MLATSDSSGVDEVLLSKHMAAAKYHAALETSCFRILALANAASLSAVGRTRLSAPFPLGLLFRSVLDDRAQVLVRVGASQVLRNLLVDVSPRIASKCLLSMLHHETQTDPHGRLARLGMKCKQAETSTGGNKQDGMLIIVCFAELIGPALFSWTGLLDGDENNSHDMNVDKDNNNNNNNNNDNDNR
jgi:hypothetical protein